MSFHEYWCEMLIVMFSLYYIVLKQHFEVEDRQESESKKKLEEGKIPCMK